MTAKQKNKTPAQAAVDAHLDAGEEVTTNGQGELGATIVELPKPAEAEELLEEPEIETVEILFRGETFVVPKNRDDWSTEALAYLTEEKYNLFVKYNLEIAKPGQWDLVCLLCPRRKDFSEFFRAFGDVINKQCVG